MSTGTPGASGGDGGGDEKGTRRGTGRSRKDVPKDTSTPGRDEKAVQEETGQAAAAQPPETATSQELKTEQAVVGQRSRRGRGAEGEASGGSSPTAVSAPSTSPPTASPGESGDLEIASKPPGLIALATRPGYGSQGRKIAILANHFQIKIPPNLTLMQYYIDITLERMPLNRDDKRTIFWRCVKENRATFPSPYTTIYDNDHICVTRGQLKFPATSTEPGGFVFEVKIRLNRMQKPETFKVRFQQVGVISIDMHQVEEAAATAGRYTTPLSVLDILFRQNRSCPEIEVSKAWYPFASTVYRIPGDAPPLGFGQVIWQGLFGSTRVGEEYTPLINFDVSHSSFYRPTSAIVFMIDVLNSKLGGGFKIDQLNATTSLSVEHLRILNQHFKGLNIVTEVKPMQGEPYMREHKVNCVMDTNSVTQTFPMTKDGVTRTVSIAEHFKDRYGDLRYPRLQVLSVGKGKRISYLPIERCNIKVCQRVTKKLLPIQTSEMIKVAAIPAGNRKQKINELLQASALPQDPWLNAFGVQIDTNMKQVEARVLKPPRIEYGFKKFATVDPTKGAWDQRQQKFYLPVETQRIAAIALDDGRDMQMIKDFLGFLLETCRELGMKMPTMIQNNVLFQINPNNPATELEQRLTELKNKQAELVIVVLPEKSSPTYPVVKRIAEITCGIMTQCVTKPTIKKTMTKRDKMTTSNIALKMNTKLGGINWKGEADATAKTILERVPTLILGIDVTHPSPGDNKAPSIAAVVGNLDASFMRYAASVRVQKHRKEAIIYLQDPVRQRLHEFFSHGTAVNEERTKAGLEPLPHGKPQQIIVYRDGVAEGQFQDVMKNELTNIRDACQALGGGDYKPKITLIVGQKRHHTRFFPASAQEAFGRGGNISLGTVVDRSITHPKLFEFYLCSHFGIQGTSRPIRYHVLTDDSELTADAVQALTFYLTHHFARCTRPVSLPAPLYYADLACRRARIHLQEKLDFSSDTMSQTGTEGVSISEEELIKGSTLHEGVRLKMYFA